METRFEDLAWRRGFSLRAALERYAPEAVAAPYLDPKNPNSITMNVITGMAKICRAMAETAALDDEHKTPALYEQRLAELTSDEVKWNDADRYARDWITDGLHEGALVAFGYELPRTHDSPALQIRQESFFGKIDLGKDRIARHGLSYAFVRVLSQFELESVRHEWNAASGAPRAAAPQGRPRKTDKISQAYCSLDQRGQIDARSIGSNYAMVRHELKQLFPNEDFNDENPSNETIRRVISPLIKQKLLPKI